MKKKKVITIITGAIALVVFAIQGCVKDTTVDLKAPGTTITSTPVSFSTQLVPLFTTDCALSGCHVSGGHAPDLTAANAYTSLTSGGYISTSTPSSSKIYGRLTAQISPGMPLTAPGSDPGGINELVLAWITQGAQNN